MNRDVIYMCMLILACLCFCQACNKGLLEPEPESVEMGYEPLSPIRLSYGMDSLQFGELWLPETTEKSPLIMIIHGGCWLSQFDYTLMDSMSLDLAKRGYIVWNIEYRRTEDAGGRWPGTFLDVAAALKYVDEMSLRFPIDKDRVIVTGHSAGGHLALWVSAHNQLEPTSDIYLESLPVVKGVVSLAGIVDLEAYISPGGCGSNVINLMGGTTQEWPDRYQMGSPIELLPLGVEQILINGEQDNIVSLVHVDPYFQKARDLGENIRLVSVPDAGHFEVIMPGSNAWPDILSAFEELSQ